MLYKLEEKTLTLKSLTEEKTYQFDLREFNFRDEFGVGAGVFDFGRGRVGFTYSSLEKRARFDPNDPPRLYEAGVLLCDLDANRVTRVEMGEGYHSIAFDPADPNVMYLNSGWGPIYSYSVAERKKKKLYGSKQMFIFDIAPSPDGRYLLFTKNKSDASVLHLFDLQSKTLVCKIGGVYHYGFLSANQAIHSYGGGIKVFDFDSKKDKLILSVASVIKRFKGHPAVDQMTQMINNSDPNRRFNDIDFCRFFRGRIYFTIALNLWRGDQPSHAKTLCSVDADLRDFQTHYHYPAEGFGCFAGRIHFYGGPQKHVFTVEVRGKDEKRWRDVCDGGTRYQLDLSWLPTLYS